MRRAVFLDRDGTINVEVRATSPIPAQVRLLPGAARAIAEHKREAGLAVVAVSNQSGHSQGPLRPGADAGRARAEVERQLREEAGACAGRLLLLPAPSRGGGGAPTPVVCDCRKPEHRHAGAGGPRDGASAMEGSFMVGDKRIDRGLRQPAPG